MKTTSLDIPLTWPTNTIHMNPHTHTQTQTHRHTQTHTHTHTQTQTQTQSLYNHLTKTRATLSQVVPVYNKTGNQQIRS